MPSENEYENALSPLEKKIARKLIQLRRENELTLSELSERSGLTESFLSRVENMKASVSIAKLAKLAEAYVLPVSAFFEGEADDTRCQITRSGKGAKIRLRGSRGIDVQLLARKVKRKMMEPILVNVSTARPDAPMQAHEGEEFMYVLEGHCRFYHGTEIHDLETGDAVYFDSAISHRIEPLDQSPSHLLSVVTSRDYTFHGNIARLINE